MFIKKRLLGVVFLCLSLKGVGPLEEDAEFQMFNLVRISLYSSKENLEGLSWKNLNKMYGLILKIKR